MSFELKDATFTNDEL
jgi:hypothetical protein